MPSDLKVFIEKLEARTKAGRLRGLMPVIEAKVRQGIRHVDIIRALNEQGFAISEHTYWSYLQRHRKKQLAGAKPAQAGAAVPNRPSTTPSVPAAGGRPRTFDYDPRGNPDLLK